MRDNFTHVHASLADIMVIARRLCKDDKKLQMDTELLEFILYWYFGFDKNQLKYKYKDQDGQLRFSWYESENLTHRTVLTNEVVKTERYSGCERQDEDWIKSGLASDEVWKIKRGC